MKNLTILHNFIKKYSKKEILLAGFYLFFLFVMILAMILDYHIKNFEDAYIELFFTLITVASMLYYLYAKNMEIALNSIVIIASLTSYALLLSNDFKISIFHIIVPLAYFLLFRLKRALLYFFIHQLIVISLYIYGYYTYVENGFTYDSSDIVATIIAVLIIFFIGILYHFGVEDTYTQLENANYQKEILLNEVHHRVKNNLQMISSMIGLQQRGETDQRVNQILEKTQLRIQSIAILYEILYKHDCCKEIYFYEYISKLIDIIIKMNDSKAKIIIDKESIYLSSKDIIKLGIITNELLTNSIKYAFTNIDGEVRISLRKEDKYLIYRYKDNGNNKIKIEKKDSLGHKLIGMMVKEMNAELSLSMKNGLVVEIKIPLE